MLYFSPILVWAIVYFGFSFDGLYGQDAYEYLRYTEALKTFFTTGKNPGDYFWGVYYPVFGSILSFIIPNIALSLQLVSVFSLIITSIYVDKLIGLVYKENADGNIPFLIFTLSPIVMIHSVLVMSDLLTCCLITVSFYSLLKFSETSESKSFLIGISFCFMAILTRYAAALVLLPVCLLVLFRIWKNKNYRLVLFSVPFVLLIGLPHLLVRLQNSLQFLSHQWLQHWSILHLFQSDFHAAEDATYNHFINLIYIGFQIVHPIFLFFGILLGAFTLTKRKFYFNRHQKLIFSSVLLYALFLGGIPFQNKRYLLLTFPILITFLYPYVKSFFTTLNHQKLIFVAVFIIQISLGICFGKKFYDRNLLETNLSKEMKQYEGRTLYSFDIDIALQGRKTPLNYKSLYAERYSGFEKNALILIHEQDITNRWQGENPAINWNAVQKECILVKLKTYDQDWNLYEIQNVRK